MSMLFYLRVIFFSMTLSIVLAPSYIYVILACLSCAVLIFFEYVNAHVPL